MVDRQLVCHGPPAATLDTLWTCIQTAWRETPQEYVQALFDSMTQRLEALIVVRGYFTPY